ncbi:MAG: hypothetical protein DIJKHBIC_01263 [Thermoanaerobaculia bacterium]|nr:hypothetical protein [Thermoanaerobaculia bacterium]
MVASEEFVRASVEKAHGLRLDYSARHSGFSGELFDRFLTGPLPALLDGLDPADLPLVESYLSLVAEGIRLGLLPGPLRDGERPRSFAQLVFSRLVPLLLPKLPRRKQADALAKLWNLSENLSSSPRYLESALSHGLAGLEALDNLEADLEKETSRVLFPRLCPLGTHPRAVWLDLSVEDTRFLPGQVHFLNPVIACIHDRARGPAGTHSEKGGGRGSSTRFHGGTVSVWMADPPVILGPSGCVEDPGPPKLQGGPHWRLLAIKDPRFTEILDTAATEWRGLATLVTSQWVVLLLPEKEKPA